METRLSGRDIALESPTDDEDDKFSPIAYLSSDSRSRPRCWKREQRRRACSPKGWKRRWASWTRVRAASSKRAGWPMTTARARRCTTLADEFGVSAERIRQIEAVALKKMKGSLASYV